MAFGLLYRMINGRSQTNSFQICELKRTVRITCRLTSTMHGKDTAMNLLQKLNNDENGFIVSAELVLVGTILVIGMIVGLTELSFNVNEELEDVGSAIGGINQTYYFTLASGRKGEVVGSTFLDFKDDCDGACDIRCDSPASGEKH